MGSWARWIESSLLTLGKGHKHKIRAKLRPREGDPLLSWNTDLPQGTEGHSILDSGSIHVASKQHHRLCWNLAVCIVFVSIICPSSFLCTGLTHSYWGCWVVFFCKLFHLSWPLQNYIIFYLPCILHLQLNVNEGKGFQYMQIKHFNWLKCNR